MKEAGAWVIEWLKANDKALIGVSPYAIVGWIREIQVDAEKASRGRCENCKHSTDGCESGWLNCNMAEYDGCEEGRKDALAIAQDADGYRAWLKVRPNFGCIQFEAKKEPAEQNP